MRIRVLIRNRTPRRLTFDAGLWGGSNDRGEAIYPSKLFTMLRHSASSGSRQTGLPARPYQYSALP